ncbi:MAG: glycosyltransferase family 1 protein [Clostridium sp.]|uniref:glycosyltransferase family 4 protein n=1 Tax=Clostridium sp. TaxID=1506 RepID=UPI0025BE6540|nr:glycosyltransferase family 1 protein [Clostridium sp.]MCH3963606.1 glycosyltransferase family 1 protein [Clostridium sp.]MCI1714747.1 glycosyltransferase family 1 protein [Clostridium sp.]MCI1799064.1 glycosyltransferase family 1 protein [Clostridium sp.]MCI1812930.1 glycosyltransferase family 1 protein [Clostridium sp.]MCI1869820.1 glycosyltransferase family 1 protein [Clostridium sp.]
MKVAIFTDTFLPQINGVTNTLSKLVEYYEKNNIDYMVFAPDNNVDEDENYNIQRFFSIKFFLYPECRIAFPNTFRLNDLLSSFKPDIIQLMTEFNMGMVGLKYGKKHGIPTVSNYTTNFCQYLNYYNLDFLSGYVWNYLRWFHNQNSLTLCPSEEAKFYLKKKGLSNTDIFSRGIDSERFNPAVRSENLRRQLGINNKLVFLYVGRVSPEKDLDILIDAYKKIYCKYRERVALIITGEGPYMDKCKDDLPENTIFTGFKRGRELAQIYASSDIFTFPSSTETFGNVVLEAMASGITVIGADAGGVRNIIEHGINGLKFKARDANELVDLMIEVIENEDLRNVLSINGRNTGLNRSWNKVFGGLMDTYNDILINKDNSVISA